MRSGPAGYAIGALCVAAPSGVAAWLAGPAITGAGSGWGVLGWFLMAVPGVAAGAWLARLHGRPGTGFFAVLITGILARLLLAAAGAAAAMIGGGRAPHGYVMGALLGFLPLQAFEVVWFHRSSAETEDGEGGSGGRRSPDGERGEA